MPKIAVIMPVYQAAGTIERAIRSVRAQTWADWELIVVDDASTDGSGAKIEALARSDNRIRFLRLERNLGAAAAMNHGWRSSAAPLVAIQDADDVALPVRLARQVDWLAEHPSISVVGASAYFFDYNNRFLRTVVPPSNHAVLKRRRWYSSPFVHSTVVMRREFLVATGGYQAGLRLGEDYDLWMRGFYLSSFEYANLVDPLIIYRARPVQRWAMIQASARVRLMAGEREGRRMRGTAAAARLLVEGAIEQTGVFALRDRLRPVPRPRDYSDLLRFV